MNESPYKQAGTAVDHTLDEARIRETGLTSRAKIKEKEETRRKAIQWKETPAYMVSRFVMLALVITAGITAGALYSSYLSTTGGCHDEVKFPVPTDHTLSCSRVGQTGTLENGVLHCKCGAP